MTQITHTAIAHRYIDLLIDNAPDELHDRDRDNYAALIDPYLDDLRTLAKLAHDAICTEPTTLFDIDSPDDIDDIAFDLDNSQIAACIDDISTAIHALAYAPPARDIDA